MYLLPHVFLTFASISLFLCINRLPVRQFINYRTSSILFWNHHTRKPRIPTKIINSLGFPGDRTRQRRKREIQKQRRKVRSWLAPLERIPFPRAIIDPRERHGAAGGSPAPTLGDFTIHARGMCMHYVAPPLGSPPPSCIIVPRYFVSRSL